VTQLLTKAEIWPQLKKGKRYRREFAAQFSKRAIPHQIALLRKQFGLTQDQLAKSAGISQGMVSRAADPDYGNLTVNTCVRIASGFDLIFVGAFVRWSELPRWFNRFYSETFTVPSFDEEDAHEEQEREQTQLATAIDAINQSLLADTTLAASATANARTIADLLRPITLLFAEHAAAMADLAKRYLEAAGKRDIIDTQLTTSPSQNHVTPVDYQLEAQSKANLVLGVRMPDQADPKSSIAA
jgi:transcriptional regulator with XRE-family HTH domain